MAIANTCTFGPTTNIQETIAAGSTSSSSINANAVLPQPANGVPGNPRSLSPGTTGGPTSCNVKIDGVAVLGASGTVSIDLTNFPGPGGTTKTLAKLRGYHVENENAADMGATGNITITAPTVNGQTFGGKLSNTGYPIAPNSFDAGGNLNTAGYTVDPTHKLVTLTAGSGGGTARYCFWGE